MFFLSYLELNALLRSMVVRFDSNLFGCIKCDYTTRFSSTIQTHIESKHVDTGGFNCPICSRLCKTRQAMKMHIRRHHPK